MVKIYVVFVVFLSSRGYKTNLLKKTTTTKQNIDEKRHLYFSKHVRGLVKLCCELDLSPTYTVLQALRLNSKGTNCIDFLHENERYDWSSLR